MGMLFCTSPSFISKWTELVPVSVLIHKDPEYVVLAVPEKSPNLIPPPLATPLNLRTVPVCPVGRVMASSVVLICAAPPRFAVFGAGWSLLVIKLVLDS